jgi:putative SOS response-associated peptidase YedK
MFRSAWKARRCLIPASGCYEWREVAVPEQKKPAKMPFYVTRKDGVPLTFAGLWERWGPDNLLTCTILTTDASPWADGQDHQLLSIFAGIISFPANSIGQL